ncbi:MAG: SWIM zinc finger family protein, partial [Acidimicrobiales bacterium]
MVRSRYWSDHWDRFPESVPLPVEDGVATTRQRGAMAEQWWSKRFADVLESYGLGARMQRGRRYARQGQVMTLQVEAGLIAAQVQGSRPTPYLVSVRLPEVSDAQWAAIEGELSSRAGLVAALLSGELPDELLDVFAAAGVPLLPDRWADLRASCTCPDAASPCKHLAAVLYVFADQLDRDPWLLLHWRGRSREEILDLLRSAEPGSDVVAPWWPFGAGELPDRLLTAALEPTGSQPDVEPAAVLDRL